MGLNWEDFHSSQAKSSDGGSWYAVVYNNIPSGQCSKGAYSQAPILLRAIRVILNQGGLSESPGEI